jgi:hypothetical protein
MPPRRMGSPWSGLALLWIALGCSAPGTSGPGIRVTPAAVAIPPGASVQFAATVTGAADTFTSVEWSVAEAGGGSVDANGLYTAPSGPGTFRVVARLAARPTVTAAAVARVADAGSLPDPGPGPLPPPIPPTPPVVPLGINVEGISDWEPQAFFADAVKQGRAWSAPGDVHTPVALDAGGWPTGDAGIVVGTAPARMARSQPYKLSYQGRARVSAESATVQNEAYDAGTNTSTADVTINQDDNFVLTFRGQVGGVKNVKLMRPGHAPGEIFSRDLLARLAHFSVVRFMQALGEPGIGSPSSPDTDWSTRVRPGFARQNTSSGIAWEYVILLANQASHDVWINVPIDATDDYVTRLAQLFRYGGDGVNPYTSPQANPVYPPLDPSRKVYVEYVNELWNGIYGSTGRNRGLALAEVQGGDPHHYAFKPGTDFQLGMRRMARRIARISDIFRAVFGDADMMTRVRPVLAAQVDNLGTLADPLEYMDAVLGPGNPFGNPGQPVGHYVWAGSGGPYLYDVPDPASVDAIFADWSGGTARQVYDSITSSKALCDRYGLKYVAYEGGPHLLSGTGGDVAKRAAQMDPRMKDQVVGLLHHWFWTAQADLFVYYTLASEWGVFGYFGLSEDITSEATPKWDAVKQVAAGQ